MTLIIFIIILGVLVVVHELGHFLAAKSAKVHVEEFGFGYPPRAISLGRRWGTLFSINWIPFGGFVKIFGENYENSSPAPQKPLASLTEASTRNFSAEKYPWVYGEQGEKRFTDVSKKWQAVILVAGVTFNILFAWFLFSVGFLIGVPAPEENVFGGKVENASLTIVALVPNSPAEQAGLRTGDQISSVSTKRGLVVENLTPENVSDFVNNSEQSIFLEIRRGDDPLVFDIQPEIMSESDRKILGIQMDMVGTLRLPLQQAFIEGARATIEISYMTVKGILTLIKDAVVGKADVSTITGPVGIVGLVGDASRLGFSYLLTFTALISINLAVVNLIPFPALDGGRLVFVVIESVTRRPINPKFAMVLNTVGFFILIGLMLIVTYRDILNLF